MVSSVGSAEPEKQAEEEEWRGLSRRGVFLAFMSLCFGTAPVGVGVKLFMLEECWVAWGFRFFDGFSLVVSGCVLLFLGGLRLRDALKETHNP